MEAFCTKQTSTFSSLIAVTWEVHPKGSWRTPIIAQTSQTTKHNILSQQLTLLSSPRCFHFPHGCLWRPAQSGLVVPRAGPFSRLRMRSRQNWHPSSYVLRIESRQMLPEQTKHSLTLELLVFYLTDFVLNCCQSSGNDIHEVLLKFFLTSTSLFENLDWKKLLFIGLGGASLFLLLLFFIFFLVRIVVWVS